MTCSVRCSTSASSLFNSSETVGSGVGNRLQLQTHFSVLSYETNNKQWATDKEIDGVLDEAMPMSGMNPVGTVVFTSINTYTINIYHHPTAVFAS
jgi:hypothetical protein